MLSQEAAFRDYYAAGWGGHTARTKRRVFNNIFVQIVGNPGLNFASADDDLQADGNLLWGVNSGQSISGDFFARFRQSPLFAASKKQYPSGWGAHDLFAAPKFLRFAADWRVPFDLRSQPDSPAVDAGVALPQDLPDPLRNADKGHPDIGALPLGTEPFKVGVAD